MRTLLDHSELSDFAMSSKGQTPIIDLGFRHNGDRIERIIMGIIPPLVFRYLPNNPHILCNFDSLILRCQRQEHESLP